MSFLIFSRNYTNPDYVANAFVSSEDADYPVDNVYNIDRRRLTWRTSGNFEIVDGENTLVFRESVGVDLTATVTAASYASDSLFFAALKSALETSGASTYTVSRDATTAKIKIVSDGLGGGGIFQLILTDIDSADMADVMGFSTASNLTGALTYQADLIRLHTSEFLTWDLGVPANPTGVIGVVDRNSVVSFSGTAVIKLQGNSTNEWSAPEFEDDVSVLDGNITLTNEDGFHTSALRYWRLYFEDKDNPDGYIELGAVCLGLHSSLTRGCPVFPLVATYKDRTNVVFSDAGRTIAGRKAKFESYELNWAGLDKPSMEELTGVWDFYGTHSSFFISMDPGSAFSTDPAKWFKLVKFEVQPVGSLVSPGNWSLTWTLREEL